MCVVNNHTVVSIAWKIDQMEVWVQRNYKWQVYVSGCCGLGSLISSNVLQTKGIFPREWWCGGAK